MPPAPIAAPNIRRLSIARFRSIKSLCWYPTQGVNFILGGGDVGKTTILDAIALLLSPTNPSVVPDTDYYGRAEKDGFVIDALLSLPPESNINQSLKPSWPWDWNGKEPIVPSIEADAGSIHNDPVYWLQVTGTEDLELVYEIKQPDGKTDSLPVALRRQIGLVRLSGDDRNDRDLRFVQGSALDRLLSDKALRSRLGNELADTDVAAGLSESARATLEELNAAFEAPAGCGKTHQGAGYVSHLLARDLNRVLVLAHTHAACSVFAERTRGVGPGAEIRTIDSVIAEIATAYHAGIDVPADPTVWVRQREDGHAQLATKVARLVKRYPMIASSLATRYATVICDEHQDSSGDQHSLVMLLHEQGSRLRLFADPMQKIFKEKRLPGANVAYSWDDLANLAGVSEALDVPHRWTSGCPRLGKWTLEAREALKSGGKVDLRQAPPSVHVVYAENLAQRNLDYRLHPDDRKPIDVFEKRQSSLLVLTRHNDTARALRSFFNRRILLWEGYT